jgi:hypothetical protein
MNNKNTRKVISDPMQCEKLCLNGYVAATQGMRQCVLQIRLTHLENIYYGLYGPTRNWSAPFHSANVSHLFLSQEQDGYL